MKSKVLSLAIILALSFCFSSYSGTVVETKDGPVALTEEQKKLADIYEGKGLSKEESVRRAKNAIDTFGRQSDPSKPLDGSDADKKEKKKGEDGEEKDGPDSDTPPEKKDNQDIPAATGKEKTPSEIKKERDATIKANNNKLLKADPEEAAQIKATMEADRAAWDQEDAQRNYDKALKEYNTASKDNIKTREANLAKAEQKLQDAVTNNYNNGWDGIKVHDDQAKFYREQAKDPSLSAEDQVAAANAADNHEKYANEKRATLDADQKAWKEEKAVKEAKNTYARNPSEENKKAFQDAQNALKTATPGSGEWGDPKYSQNAATAENDRIQREATRNANLYESQGKLDQADAERERARSAKDANTANALSWEKDEVLKRASSSDAGVRESAKATLKDIAAGKGQWEDQWGASRNEKPIPTNDPAWTPGGDAYARKRATEELTRQKNIASTPEEAAAIDRTLELDKNTWKTEDAKYNLTQAKNNLNSVSKYSNATKSDIDNARSAVTSAQKAYDTATAEPNQWGDASNQSSYDVTTGDTKADQARRNITAENKKIKDNASFVQRMEDKISKGQRLDPNRVDSATGLRETPADISKAEWDAKITAPEQIRQQQDIIATRQNEIERKYQGKAAIPYAARTVWNGIKSAYHYIGESIWKTGKYLNQWSW